MAIEVKTMTLKAKAGFKGYHRPIQAKHWIRTWNDNPTFSKVPARKAQTQTTSTTRRKKYNFGKPPCKYWA